LQLWTDGQTSFDSNSRAVLRVMRAKTDKRHIFAPTASALSSISPKLCTVIEDVETIQKGETIIFRSNA